MKFSCQVTREAGNRCTIRHQSDDVGSVQVSAPTREEALDKIRGEIRYRLEMCPCSGESYQHIEIDLIDAG